MTSRTVQVRRRPRSPPGCNRAKSSGPNPRNSDRAIARASPIARVAVVLAVGARSCGHASISTLTSSTRSARRARLEPDSDVRATTEIPNLPITGIRLSSSSDSPLLEMARTRSPATSTPTSPWAASPGWRKMAGVPVEENVDASFRATFPDFPIPVTTTRPVMESIRRTASANVASRRSASEATLSLSMRSTSLPRSMIRESASRPVVLSVTRLRPPMLDALRDVLLHQGAPFASRRQQGLDELAHRSVASCPLPDPCRGLLDLGHGVCHCSR